MADITVHRKAYIRKDGTRVAASNFKVKDRGRKRATPLNQRGYEPKTGMNWHKNLPASTRRRRAVSSHKGDVLAAARALQALANVTTDRGTAAAARQDAKALFALHNKRTAAKRKR